MSRHAEIVATTKRILKEALQLGHRADALTEGSRLMGAIPELDSMAVVTLLTMFEDELGIVIEDDEVTGDIFQTVGTLAGFVESAVSR